MAWFVNLIDCYVFQDQERVLLSFITRAPQHFHRFIAADNTAIPTHYPAFGLSAICKSQQQEQVQSLNR
jgi:hypothetical protein